MTEWTSLQSLEEDLIQCRRCPRLVEWREQVACQRRKAYRDWEYWGRPVPGFGDPQARLLVVGLAPGAHGSNRTGRMFTGDESGVFLYRALYQAGFASQPTTERRGDGLELRDVFITAVGRCAPPDNKPTPAEIETCRPYLLAELDLLPNLEGIVALGAIAFNGLLAAYRSRGYDLPRLEFGHGAFAQLPHGLPWLLSSYHPSRQNTQTGRLTAPMFDQIWVQARQALSLPKGEQKNTGI